MLENFTLPTYLKEVGGDKIFDTFVVEDRKSIGTERSDNFNALSKFNLYWPSPYGHSVIDCFVKSD